MQHHHLDQSANDKQAFGRLIDAPDAMRITISILFFNLISIFWLLRASQMLVTNIAIRCVYVKIPSTLTYPQNCDANDVAAANSLQFNRRIRSFSSENDCLFRNGIFEFTSHSLDVRIIIIFFFFVFCLVFIVRRRF